MSKKNGKLLLCVILLAAVTIVGGFTCWFYSEPLQNRRGLGERIAAAEGSTVVLHQLTPFSWNEVYTFSPYTSKEEIARTIGFDSSRIQETVSEGMTQLLFVEAEEVVCSVCAYPENLGYGVSGLPQGQAVANQSGSPRCRVVRRGDVLWLEFLD